MKIHIYAIYFPTSNKYYIGQTCNINTRLPRHLENKSLIGNALRKYDDWVIEILHTTKNKDEANRIEIEEIRHYNSVVPNGYNLTRGGEGAGLGNKNANGNKSFKGCHHTKESNEKNRQAHLGKKHTKEVIEKIKAYKYTKEQCESRSLKAKGNKNSPDISGKKNPSCRVDVKIKKLQNHIKRLEKELENENSDLFPDN